VVDSTELLRSELGDRMVRVRRGQGFLFQATCSRLVGEPSLPQGEGLSEI
jgi:hypothetical protein